MDDPLSSSALDSTATESWASHTPGSEPNPSSTSMLGNISNRPDLFGEPFTGIEWTQPPEDDFTYQPQAPSMPIDLPHDTMGSSDSSKKGRFSSASTDIIYRPVTPPGRSYVGTQPDASESPQIQNEELSATPKADQRLASRLVEDGFVPSRLASGALDLKAIKTKLFSAVSSSDLKLVREMVLASQHDHTLEPEYPGPFEIVNWTNSEGETPLHVASYKGSLPICIFLETQGSNPTASDNDGWTPLHNAASKGWGDIVRWLVEEVGVDTEDGESGLERKNKKGYTALMNAASRGHLPLILYLLTKHRANPLARNKYKESAYDLAASVFEIHICQVLGTWEWAYWGEGSEGALTRSISDLQDLVFNTQQQPNSAGSNAFHQPSATPYNPFKVHSTVPVVLYENQRLLLPSIKKMSVFAGTQTNKKGKAPQFANQDEDFGRGIRWTSKALTRNDGRAAYTWCGIPGLPTSILPNDVSTGTTNLPVFKFEVNLPSLSNPSKLVLPAPRETRSAGKVVGVDEPIKSKGKETKRRTTITDKNRPAVGQSKNPTAKDALNAVLAPRTTQDIADSGASSPTGSETPRVTHRSEPAWFWLSDWTIDLTDPRSDPVDGWSYAASFDTPDEDWTPEPPAEVDRMLEASEKGLGLSVGAGLSNGQNKKYVRRRRWVRVMRRRLDVMDWGYLDDAAAPEKIAVPGPTPGETFENEQTPLSTDYLAKAQFLAGFQQAASGAASIRSLSGIDETELRKRITRFTGAVDEIRQGIVGDTSIERKRRAEAILEEYLGQLVLLKNELATYEGDQQDEDEDSDEEFIYSARDPNAEEDAYSTFTAAYPVSPVRSMSMERGTSQLSLSQLSASPLPTSALSLHPPEGIYLNHDLTPDLSQAPEFRVPTHETSQIRHERPTKARINTMPLLLPLSSTAPTWEPNHASSHCRRCSTKFSFFNRKHHCRCCGLLVCATCSPFNDQLEEYQVVREPGNYDDEPWSPNARFRTCKTCHTTLDLHLPTSGTATTSFLGASLGALFPGTTLGASHLGVQSTSSLPDSISHSEGDASDASELTECPVCGEGLSNIGGKAEQEMHVQECLENGGGAIVTKGRYLVFKLPAGPLVGEECKICFVEFELGDRLARLPCLCCFHQQCISAWLSRGKSCPFHASRDL